MHQLLRRTMIKNAALCDEKGKISLFLPLKFPPFPFFFFFPSLEEHTVILWNGWCWHINERAVRVFFFFLFCWYFLREKEIRLLSV